MNDIGRRPKRDHPNSKYWMDIRSKVLKRGQGCCLCFEQERLEVHHRTYKHYGSERMEELTTLCHECHNLITLAQIKLRDVKRPIKIQPVSKIEIGRIEITNFYNGEKND